jgi:hypothetical protein
MTFLNDDIPKLMTGYGGCVSDPSTYMFVPQLALLPEMGIGGLVRALEWLTEK